ncbi:MAG TPA: SCO family protein [Terriglobales bacterium]|nr:SCO family protein [Terriglobales bacterium]
MKLYATIGTVFISSAALLAQASGDMRKADDLRQQNTRPSVLENVGIDQRLGQALPLEAKFRDELGREVKLGQYFHKRPVLLALVYYDCPMLCTQVLNGLTSAIGVLKFNAGQEFDVVAVSFDPRETPQLAGTKKQVYLDRYKRAGADQGIHFLTGDPESIKALTEAAGFRYVWDEKTSQFAHASAVMLVTPEGRLSQYYYGIEYSPKDMRLGIIEASNEKIGNVVDQIILYCFHYDPTTGKYGAAIMNLIRAGGVLTVLVLGTFMAVSFRRDARNSRRYPELEDRSI